MGMVLSDFQWKLRKTCGFDDRRLRGKKIDKMVMSDGWVNAIGRNLPGFPRRSQS